MYLFRYLFFLFSATNQHGVHSPFVFTFVTKCLYKKQKYNTSKSLNTALKMLEYFNIFNVRFKDMNTELSEEIEKKFPKIVTDESSINFIYLETLSLTNLEFLEKFNDFNNETVVFINTINKTYKRWNTLILSKKFTVTIDTFHSGILFFRREQEKEHFKIRI
jgi:hypothetical protein